MNQRLCHRYVINDLWWMHWNHQWSLMNALKSSMIIDDSSTNPRCDTDDHQRILLTASMNHQWFLWFRNWGMQNPNIFHQIVHWDKSFVKKPWYLWYSLVHRSVRKVFRHKGNPPTQKALIPTTAPTLACFFLFWSRWFVAWWSTTIIMERLPTFFDSHVAARLKFRCF